MRSDGGLAVVLGAAAALLYALVGSEQRGTSSFPDLADALLHGRAYLIGARPWEELAIRAGGGFWVPFPPFPAVVLVPVVALLGAGFDLALASAVAGGLCVGLAYGLARDLGATRSNATWLAVALAIGSELLWGAGDGGHHLFAQVVALALVLGAFRLAVNDRWPLAAGLLLGAAVASRLPAVFAIPVAAALYVARRPPPRGPSSRDRIRRLVLLGAPIVVIGLALAAYNAARFGSPFEFGYGLIVSGTDQQTGCIPSTCTYPTSEWWFSAGIESISYIPRSLQKML
ncbi:MAG TPA: hypothetical protein VET90_03425, partial [Candidatus Binatus sp.]|nr:hypothetical protein [Candidatus Binatus sp.]